ncbi:VIT and vWA domain-containing protein [Leptothrix discophora]|uniref:VIT and VWA domain-containing protein n=1 Tax=Leptothrix discophora TaxID=89 RepID=A0ABT9G658_LEPDI|nr:VIT and VWA domain-containing protein [Leptothrix discophora]MDP4301974.1 VIT and VWA domain-containing protein [Leptothrix discophora]
MKGKNMDQRECARLETRDGQAVNLIGVRLSGDLRGLMFEARIEQRFCNPVDKNVELVYSFPLPWGAVLLGVDVVLGNKRLTGAVVEKKKAEAHYEEAISEGDAVIMLEKNRDHSYSLNLGNLAAREHGAITLRYDQTLQFEQRGLRLLIPTVIAPRYGNAQHDGGLMPHQEPSHSLTADHLFELELRLHGELAQSRVASPSHPVGVAHGNSDQGSMLTVSLARRESLDRDFALVVDQPAHDSVAIAAQDCVVPSRVAILASFCPRIRAQGIPSTVVKILVDCSGSMAGDSIDAAKRALQAIVRQFGADDCFSLSRFGSTVEHRSRGLWKATDTTKLAAQRWVGALKADLGGTEMEAALSSTFSLAQPVSSDILLVTDGEISAIERTIESAKHSGHRLFVVGIGSSPAETHLRRLAEATGGACDFVVPGEAVEPAVLRMFARLRSPRLADLSLEWPAGVVPEWVSPLLPSVFDGDTVNAFALFGQLPTGEVRLLGRRSDDDMPREIGTATLPSRLDVADTLSRMAASVHFHSAGNNISIGQPVDATRLAVDYQLVTDKTNFLLVHERPDGEKAIDMPELQKINQMVPAGWAGTGTAMFSRSAVFHETRVVDDQTSGSLDWNDGNALPVPAVFRTVREPSAKFCLIDEITIPAFLRKRDQIIDQQDRRYWTESEHDSGLTPLGVSEWLRITPASEWPTTYMGLRQMGVGEWLVEWLELVMASRQDTPYPEPKVVEAFLYLLSRRDTHEALVKSEGLLGALESTVLRLRGIFAGEPDDRSVGINGVLVEAMAAVLDGMTASAWPDRVFSMGGAVDEVCDAREPATIA